MDWMSLGLIGLVHGSDGVFLKTKRDLFVYSHDNVAHTGLRSLATPYIIEYSGGRISFRIIGTNRQLVVDESTHILHNCDSRSGMNHQFRLEYKNDGLFQLQMAVNGFYYCVTDINNDLKLMECDDDEGDRQLFRLEATHRLVMQ
ncbi:hypothetical protein ECANGB1_1892 [Enterospora canceri]|uniref:Ricin B lectin domain-containing protein n=1 Tax=Enterospora canceri TaxID=1081671 RepID=A0A1Y1S907_9MICR|nr:hypothetical protein ECANGB1_1892 [Enterospora canceri]